MYKLSLLPRTWLYCRFYAEELLGRGLILMDPPYEPYNEYTAWNHFLLRPHVHDMMFRPKHVCSYTYIYIYMHIYMYTHN